MNSFPDAPEAVANNVKYHQRCWLYWLYKKHYAEKTNKTYSDIDSIETDDTSRVIAKIEILNVVKCELDRKENADFNMNI